LLSSELSARIIEIEKDTALVELLDKEQWSFVWWSFWKKDKGKIEG
jgi:hypothetical protein